MSGFILRSSPFYAALAAGAFVAAGLSRVIRLLLERVGVLRGYFTQPSPAL
jgi:hypothetical protein